MRDSWKDWERGGGGPMWTCGNINTRIMEHYGAYGAYGACRRGHGEVMKRTESVSEDG